MHSRRRPAAQYVENQQQHHGQQDGQRAEGLGLGRGHRRILATQRPICPPLPRSFSLVYPYVPPLATPATGSDPDFKRDQTPSQYPAICMAKPQPAMLSSSLSLSVSESFMAIARFCCWDHNPLGSILADARGGQPRGKLLNYWGIRKSTNQRTRIEQNSGNREATGLGILVSAS